MKTPSEPTPNQLNTMKTTSKTVQTTAVCETQLADMLQTIRTHRQQWVRIFGSEITVTSLAILSDAERTSIRRMIANAQPNPTQPLTNFGE